MLQISKSWIYYIEKSTIVTTSVRITWLQTKTPHIKSKALQTLHVHSYRIDETFGFAALARVSQTSRRFGFCHSWARFGNTEPESRNIILKSEPQNKHVALSLQNRRRRNTSILNAHTKIIAPPYFRPSIPFRSIAADEFSIAFFLLLLHIHILIDTEIKLSSFTVAMTSLWFIWVWFFLVSSLTCFSL